MLPNSYPKVTASGPAVLNAYSNWHDNTRKDQLIATCPRPDWLLALLFKGGISRNNIVSMALLCVKNVRTANNKPHVFSGLKLAEKWAAAHTDVCNEDIAAAVKSCRQCAKFSPFYGVGNRPNSAEAWAADAVASLLEACVQTHDQKFIRHIQEAVRASVSVYLLMDGNIDIYAVYCNKIRQTI